MLQDRINLSTPQCVWWNRTRLQWSSYGCVVGSHNTTHTVCHCNHLTYFAVLMDVHHQEVSKTLLMVFLKSQVNVTRTTRRRRFYAVMIKLLYISVNNTCSTCFETLIQSTLFDFISDLQMNRLKKYLIPERERKSEREGEREKKLV